MRKALRFFAILALVAGIGAAEQVVMAACNDGLTQFYPVNQCGRSTWFAAPPTGAGTVSAAWWQVGFGNNDISNGGGAAGTGFQFGVGFLGNDSGLDTGDPSLLDLVPATVVGGPTGSLCFSSAANWARPGVDGCSDNPRTGTGPYGYSKDDNILNPYFASGVPGGAGIGLYTTAYQLDAPMAVLLTESSGKSFALAFFASDSRGADPNNLDPGQWDMQDIANGDPNPLTGLNNVIPWQPVPEPFATVTFTNPSDTTSDRIVNMNWTAIRLVSDNSSRPSADTTMPVSGVGVNDQGTLAHYSVETAPIVDASGACGTFSSATSTDTTSASVTVPGGTCVRLRTSFGRVPACGGSPTGSTAAQGLCGDVGYSVVSSTRLIAGQLSSQKVNLVSVTSVRNVYRIEFTTTSELNASTFQVVGVDQKGKTSVLASTNCAACNSGLGSTYTLEVARSEVKGAKSIYVVMQPSGDKSNEVPLR